MSSHSPSVALNAVVKRLSDRLRRAFARRRPWIELVDTSTISRPASLSDATVRIRKNLSYFRINYWTVLAVVLALSLLSHPFALLTLVDLLVAWLYFYLLRPSDQPVVILNRTFSDRETLGILLVLSIFVICLTSVGSLLMWSTLIGFGIICVHAAFRDPEDLFLDDQDLAGSGFFPFLGGAASPVAPAAAPAVVTNV